MPNQSPHLMNIIASFHYLNSSMYQSSDKYLQLHQQRSDRHLKK